MKYPMKKTPQYPLVDWVMQQSVVVLLNSHVPNYQIEIDPSQTQNNKPDKKQVTTGVHKRKAVIGEVFHTSVQTFPILFSFCLLVNSLLLFCHTFALL